jgi:hypothetical protein
VGFPRPRRQRLGSPAASPRAPAAYDGGVHGIGRTSSAARHERIVKRRTCQLSSRAKTARSASTRSSWCRPATLSREHCSLHHVCALVAVYYWRRKHEDRSQACLAARIIC